MEYHHSESLSGWYEVSIWIIKKEHPDGMRIPPGCYEKMIYNGSDFISDYSFQPPPKALYKRTMAIR